MRWTALLLLTAVSGCSHHGGGGATAATSTAALPASTRSPAAATGEEDVRPLVLVHGISGSPDNWDPIVVDGLARGRAVFRDAYADDIAMIPSASVSRSSVWAVGYYKKRAADARFFQGQGSIGGCPVARTDQGASYYPSASYTYPSYPQQQAPRPDVPHEAAKKEKMVAFDAAVGTIFPLGLGPELSLELPGRILLQGDVMWMPGAYGNVISGIVQSAAGSDSLLAPIVKKTLSSSLSFRVHAGWRPFKDHGFELGGGYTGIKVSGNLTPQEIGDIVGGDIGARVPQELNEDVTLRSMMHNFHVTAGWRWVPAEHFVIRAFLGYTQTLTSSTSVEIPGHADIQAQVQPVVDQEVNKVLKSDVKLPLLGLNLGVRF